MKPIVSAWSWAMMLLALASTISEEEHGPREMTDADNDNL